MTQANGARSGKTHTQAHAHTFAFLLPQKAKAKFCILAMGFLLLTERWAVLREVFLFFSTFLNNRQQPASEVPLSNLRKYIFEGGSLGRKDPVNEV